MTKREFMKAMAEAAGGKYTYGEAFVKDGFHVHFSIGDDSTVSTRYMYDDVIRCLIGPVSDGPVVLAKNLTEWLDSNPFLY
jgi:hypothetical protein